MDKQTKIENLKKMIEELNDQNLTQIYGLVWSLTAKDLIIDCHEDKQKRGDSRV